MNGMDGIERLDGMFRMVRLKWWLYGGMGWTEGIKCIEWNELDRIKFNYKNKFYFQKEWHPNYFHLSNSICTYERCKYVQRVHTGVKFSPEQLNSVPARLLCTTVLLTVAEVLNQGTPVSTVHNQNLKVLIFYAIMFKKIVTRGFKQKIVIVYFLQWCIRTPEELVQLAQLPDVARKKIFKIKY